MTDDTSQQDTPQLPEPGVPDECPYCERTVPLYVVSGKQLREDLFDHVHICTDCLRVALESKQSPSRADLVAQRDEARVLARQYYQAFLAELDWHLSEPLDPSLPAWLTEVQAP